jgi:hypothetical protein
MTTWNLERGAERPLLNPPRRPVIGIGNITPKQIADRAEELGARVASTGDRYKIFPPDPDQDMISIPARMGNGTERANLIARLRRAGLDIMKPSPADIPRKTINAAASAPVDTSALLEMLAESERRHAELLDRVRTLEEREEDPEVLRQVEAQRLLIGDAAQSIDNLTRRMVRYEQDIAVLGEARDRLVARVEELERGWSGEVVRKPTSAVVRDLALAWFENHPGIRVSPELVKLNLGDQLPADTRPEAVATACKDLATAGKISGGGTNTKGKRGPTGTRGIYWFEPAAS